MLESGHKLVNVLTEGAVTAFAERALQFQDAVKNEGTEHMAVTAAEWWKERQALEAAQAGQ